MRTIKQTTASQSLGIIIPAISGVYISQMMISIIAMQSLLALLREEGYSLQLIELSSIFLLPGCLNLCGRIY